MKAVGNRSSAYNATKLLKGKFQSDTSAVVSSPFVHLKFCVLWCEVHHQNEPEKKFFKSLDVLDIFSLN